MLGESINIKNFNWNPVVLKKLLFFGLTCEKWGPHGPHPKQKTIFFSEITKVDSKLSKPFYFNKIPYVSAEL